MLFLAPVLTHCVSRALKNLSEAEFCVQFGTWVAAPLRPHSCLFKSEQLNTDFAVPIAVLLALETCNFSGTLLFLLLSRLSLPTKIHFPLFGHYDLLTFAFSGHLFTIWIRSSSPCPLKPQSRRAAHLQAVLLASSVPPRSILCPPQRLEKGKVCARRVLALSFVCFICRGLLWLPVRCAGSPASFPVPRW